MSGLAPEIETALAKLKAQGHAVSPYMRDGKLWFEIDRKMLASYEEMKELGAGVYSLEELEELMRQRRDEERGKL